MMPKNVSINTGDNTQIAFRDIVNKGADTSSEQADAEKEALKNPGTGSKVFISVVDEELRLASLIQRYIDQIPEWSPCFVGGYSIMPGEHWLTSVKVALQECKLFIVLLSTQSINHHWVLRRVRGSVGARCSTSGYHAWGAPG